MEVETPSDKQPEKLSTIHGYIMTAIRQIKI